MGTIVEHLEIVERRALRALSARSLGQSVTSFDALVG
jgi:hypothetical protein